MKKNYWFLPPFCLSRALALVFVLGLVLEGSAFGQGSLTPPGPPGVTMKTLQQIEPRTPLNTLLGDSSAMFLVTQPGSYYLTTNLVVGPGTNAMRILVSDVAIDLNGFTIYGTTSRTAIQTFGPNLARVRIHNGSLVGWGGGVDFVSNGVVTNGPFEDLALVFSNLNNAMRMLVVDLSIDLKGFPIYATPSRTAIQTFGPNLARVRIHNGSLVGWGEIG